MKLRVLMTTVVLVVIFLITGSVYAANGDLIVNGNVGVGTITPQAKLDVVGDISFEKDGKRFVLKYYNFSYFLFIMIYTYYSP